MPSGHRAALRCASRQTSSNSIVSKKGVPEGCNAANAGQPGLLERLTAQPLRRWRRAAILATTGHGAIASEVGSGGRGECHPRLRDEFQESPAHLKRARNIRINATISESKRQMWDRLVPCERTQTPGAYKRCKRPLLPSSGLDFFPRSTARIGVCRCRRWH